MKTLFKHWFKKTWKTDEFQSCHERTWKIAKILLKFIFYLFLNHWIVFTCFVMTYCDGESTQEKFSSKWAVFAIAQLVIFFIMINFFQSAQFFQATQKSENGKTSNSILNFQVLNLQSSDSSSSNPKSSDKTSLENEEIKTESKIYPVPKEEPEQFHCPTFRELDSVPESCYENTPKHPAIYKSSFYPIYPPRNPGPSEQTHGIKDVVMAAVELGKSVIISNFTTHFSDSHSKCFIIPFGGRVDLESLCRFVTLKDSRKMIEENPELKIDTLVTLSNNHNVPWEQHQLTRYLKENAACGNYKFDGICKWSSLEWIEDLARFKNISIWGTKYSNFPHNDGENLYKTFIDNDIAYDKPEVIGLAHSFNWIYGNTYQFIDSGGAYRFRNPVFGESLAPVISEDYAREKLGIKRGLLKDTYVGEFWKNEINNSEKNFEIKFQSTCISKLFFLSSHPPPEIYPHLSKNVHRRRVERNNPNFRRSPLAIQSRRFFHQRYSREKRGRGKWSRATSRSCGASLEDPERSQILFGFTYSAFGTKFS